MTWLTLDNHLPSSLGTFKNDRFNVKLEGSWFQCLSKRSSIFGTSAKHRKSRWYHANESHVPHTFIFIFSKLEILLFHDDFAFRFVANFLIDAESPKCFNQRFVVDAREQADAKGSCLSYTQAYISLCIARVLLVPPRSAGQ